MAHVGLRDARQAALLRAAGCGPDGAGWAGNCQIEGRGGEVSPPQLTVASDRAVLRACRAETWLASRLGPYPAVPVSSPFRIRVRAVRTGRGIRRASWDATR